MLLSLFSLSTRSKGEMLVLILPLARRGSVMMQFSRARVAARVAIDSARQRPFDSLMKFAISYRSRNLLTQIVLVQPFVRVTRLSGTEGVKW